MEMHYDFEQLSVESMKKNNELVCHGVQLLDHFFPNWAKNWLEEIVPDSMGGIFGSIRFRREVGDISGYDFAKWFFTKFDNRPAVDTETVKKLPAFFWDPDLWDTEEEKRALDKLCNFFGFEIDYHHLIQNSSNTEEAHKNCQRETYTLNALWWHHIVDRLIKTP